MCSNRHLPTTADFIDQIRTRRALFFVAVAYVRYCWMSARLWSGALVGTWWWFRTASDRWLDCSSSTVASELFPRCFEARVTRPSVAKHWAIVGSTLQQLPTTSGANVFGLEPFIDARIRRSQWSRLLLLLRQSLHSCSLARTTLLTTLMALAIERNSAIADAHWRFIV